MNRSAHLSSPSYLPTLFDPASPGASLLATLSVQRGPTAEDVDPIAVLEEARASQPILVARTAREPRVKRDIDQCTQSLAAAKTPEEFLAAPGVLKVLLIASGLGDQTGNTDLASWLLLSDPAEIDIRKHPRWSDLCDDCSFATTGIANLRRPLAIEGIAKRYAEAIWRMNLVQKIPGLSNALDFLSRASSIKSVAQIAGDPTFRTVVATTLGIPEQIVIAVPEEAVGPRVDPTKFQDRSFVDDFTRRYLLTARSAASVVDTSWSGSTPELPAMSGLVV